MERVDTGTHPERARAPSSFTGHTSPWSALRAGVRAPSATACSRSLARTSRSCRPYTSNTCGPCSTSGPPRRVPSASGCTARSCSTWPRWTTHWRRWARSNGRDAARCSRSVCAMISGSASSGASPLARASYVNVGVNGETDTLSAGCQRWSERSRSTESDEQWGRHRAACVCAIGFA